jgi:hypothetical protein
MKREVRNYDKKYIYHDEKFNIVMEESAHK